MRRLLAIISILFFPALAFAQHSIEGVWSNIENPNMSGAIELDLSWGNRMVSRHIDLVVDLHSDPPTFWIPGAFYPPDRILSFSEKGNETELTVYSANSGTIASATFRFNEDGTMQVVAQQYAGRGYYFPRLVLHKHDGPEFGLAADATRRSLAFERTHITDRNLPLRERAEVRSPVIKTLPANSDVWLHESFTRRFASPSIIHEWSRVSTVDGIVGWLFTRYGRNIASPPWSLEPDFGETASTPGHSPAFHRTHTINNVHMPLRERASTNSPVIMTLIDGTDIQLLELVSRRAYGASVMVYVWAKVATADGTTGWLYFQYERINEVLP